MHGWYEGWSWWGWLLMTAGMVAFWGLVLWLVVSLVRSPAPSDQAERRSAERLLDERFASGDIDESEYRERGEALRSTKADVR